MLVRNAEIKDIEAIRGIYNEAIVNSTATFDTEEKSYEDRLEWFKGYNEKHPLLVVEIDGIARAWGALKPYSDRKAYDNTCEISLYIHKDFRGRGLGSLLMEELIKRAEINKIHVIISRVAGANEASKNIHKKFGFILAGVVKEVGFKFDKYIDIYMYQKII